MIADDETFNGTWPFKPHFTNAAGFKQHYVDEGAGEVVLCLHGEPTWGYLYRQMIPDLATHYRVVVPDHMGFGKAKRRKTANIHCRPTSRIRPLLLMIWASMILLWCCKTGAGQWGRLMPFAIPTRLSAL